MSTLPARDDIAGNPSRATAKTAFGQLWDAINERFFSGSGTAAEKAASRGALEATRALQPIAAAVASNALTITLNPTTLEFRHPTLSNGTVNTRVVSAPITLTVSSGSTLGTTNAAAARLVVLAIDNGGTVELAVVNQLGGMSLDETGVISTTAEGGAGAADSSSVIYSQTARSNVPYRVVGVITSTQATAGTWATAPSAVQAVGGQAFTSMNSLGHGQQWQDVTASRAGGTNYVNTTGKPIYVAIVLTSLGPGSRIFTVGGVTFTQELPNGVTASLPFFFIVPPGATYSINNTFTKWLELR